MKTKTINQQIKECIKKISEEDLKFISQRLSIRLCGDFGEALEFIQNKHPDLNKIFSSAVNYNELYNMIDILHDFLKEK